MQGQDLVRDAEEAISLYSRIANSPTTQAIINSPYAQLLLDGGKTTFSWALVAAGPFFYNFEKTRTNFIETHNTLRNVLYAVIETGILIAFVYFSITDPDFRGLIGFWATTDGITTSNNLTGGMVIYADYFASTWVSDIVVDKIGMNLIFTVWYGDREYGLSSKRKTELAQIFGVSEQEIADEFQNIVKQLRAGKIAFGTGANEADLHVLLRALVNSRRSDVKSLYDQHVKKFHNYIKSLEGEEDKAKQQFLLQFRRRFAREEHSLEYLTAEARAAATTVETAERILVDIENSSVTSADVGMLWNFASSIASRLGFGTSNTQRPQSSSDPSSDLLRHEHMQRNASGHTAISRSNYPTMGQSTIPTGHTAYGATDRRSLGLDTI